MKTRSGFLRFPALLSLLLLSLLLLSPEGRCLAQPSAADAAVAQALAKAGDNRAELERALAAAPEEERRGMAFLVANMPDSDLKSLQADFLLANSALAWRARREMPWGKDVPEAIFFNDVLPYANVDEKRDPWRQEMYDLCLPIAKTCQTPSEAAHKLNVEVFPKLQLKYSTQRAAPNQSPKESIAQGKASCTGLSIVLSDACRAMCVPARLAGTPLWANKRGNHTWVEIWDGGWHFTGACEPDKNGLDRGWFVGDAAMAKKDSFEHAIYAASFGKTELHFPLVWAMNDKSVPAENVTDRYAKKQPAAAGTVRVLVRVVNGGQRRIEAAVSVSAADAQETRSGKSRGETADANDILSFDLPPGVEYVVKVGDRTKTVKPAADAKELLVEIVVP